MVGYGCDALNGNYVGDPLSSSTIRVIGTVELRFFPGAQPLEYWTGPGGEDVFSFRPSHVGYTTAISASSTWTDSTGLIAATSRPSTSSRGASSSRYRGELAAPRHPRSLFRRVATSHGSARRAYGQFVHGCGGRRDLLTSTVLQLARINASGTYSETFSNTQLPDRPTRVSPLLYDLNIRRITRVLRCSLVHVSERHRAAGGFSLAPRRSCYQGCHVSALVLAALSLVAVLAVACTSSRPRRPLISPAPVTSTTIGVGDLSRGPARRREGPSHGVSRPPDGTIDYPYIGRAEGRGLEPRRLWISFARSSSRGRSSPTRRCRSS